MLPKGVGQRRCQCEKQPETQNTAHTEKTTTLCENLFGANIYKTLDRKKRTKRRSLMEIQQ